MSKSIGSRVDFVAVFTDNTRRGALFEEAFIHTAKITAIRIALKEIHMTEDKQKMSNI